MREIGILNYEAQIDGRDVTVYYSDDLFPMDKRLVKAYWKWGRSYFRYNMGELALKFGYDRESEISYKMNIYTAVTFKDYICVACGNPIPKRFRNRKQCISTLSNL